jgi:predicted  nucleic acid-binding Zn-ribbon protein
MHPSIPHLLDLQSVEHRIAGVRAEIDSLPKRVQEADAKLAGSRAAVTAAKEANATALAERKKLELDAMQWRDRARKYRDQSGAVKTNEAYKALQHEIANAEAEAVKAEDRQLEVMVGAEDTERRVKNSEANLRESETSVNAEKQQILALNSGKKKSLEALLAERTRVIAPVPEDMRVLYDRIAKRHHGTALAEAREGQCRGCGLRVLPHIEQLLKSESDEEIYRCESCGLILYSLQPIPIAKPDSGPDSAGTSASTSS